MNTARVAQALNTISVAFGELAEALNESSDPVRSGGPEAGEVAPSAPVATTFEASPFDFEEAQPSLADASVEFADQGSEAMCPAHKKPYRDGNYGPYCTALALDPAWADKKGYCKITPKNAAQYLRVKAAA